MGPKSSLKPSHETSKKAKIDFFNKKCYNRKRLEKERKEQMAYNGTRHKQNAKNAEEALWGTTKKNFKGSVDPRGKILTARVPATSNLVNGVLLAIGKVGWNTLRRLLNK